MDINSVNLRKIMSEFATGVCIIAFDDKDSNPTGVTINSFTSVSIDPPLVLFCLKNSAESLSKILATQQFSINILASDQEELTMKCVIRGGHKLDDVIERSDMGIPYLPNAIATIECEHNATYPGGDHTIVTAKVINLKHHHHSNPLIFHRSKFV